MALQDTDNLIVSRGGTNYKMPAQQLKDYTGKVEVSGTAPPAPVEGLLWWDTTTERLYIWDGTDWADASPQVPASEFVNTSGDTMTGNLNVPSLNGGPLAGLRNRIINGDFRIDQRNSAGAATITAGAALVYPVDRFYAYCTGANVTGQRVTVAGTQVDPTRYQFTGAASVTGIGFAQRIEAANSRDLAGKTVTLSANFSNSLLTTVTWTAYYANTTDTFGTLASPTRTQIATGTFTVNSTYSRYDVEIAIPSAATTGIEIVFTVGAQTSGTWTIGQVQLEEGTVATPFEQIPIGLSILLSQRYFCTRRVSGRAWAVGAGQISENHVWLPVAMRVTPTVAGPTGAANLNVSSAVLLSADFQGARFVVTAAGANDFYSLNGLCTFDAEL